MLVKWGYTRDLISEPLRRVASSSTSISKKKRLNSPESTYRRIMKPDAFPMDCGWYRLHRGAMGHGSDAMARTPGRVVRL